MIALLTPNKHQHDSTETVVMDYREVQRSLEESLQLGHPLTRYLQQKGFTVEIKRFSEETTSLFYGLRFQVGRSEIIYRLITEDTVLIVSYRRIGPRRGMLNAFREFFWFIDLLTKPELGLKRVIGCVEAFQGSELSSKRILYLYTRRLNGKVVRFREQGYSMGGGTWVCLDLKDYQPLRALWKKSLKEEVPL